MDIAETTRAALEPVPVAEYRQRVEQLRRRMRAQSLDVVVLTGQANVEYFSGFDSPFPWSSPSRAMHLAVALEGEPVGFVPELLVSTWRSTSWVENTVAWESPRAGDEGVSELVAWISALPRRFGRIGLELGAESRIQTTVEELLMLQQRLGDWQLADCAAACRAVRIVKSRHEIERVRRACTVASDVFDAWTGFVHSGLSEWAVARRFAAHAFLAGADDVPFIAMRSGAQAYDSVVTGPSQRVLQRGDVVTLDTGVRVQGYFCDFNRNIAVGPPHASTLRLHEAMYQATEAALAIARPGSRACDLYRAQAAALEAHGCRVGKLGRMGHGLGKVLTEWPSNKPDDATELQPGMVMTIEPAAMREDGRMLVTEENIVITEHGHELLSRRAPRELPVVG